MCSGLQDFIGSQVNETGKYFYFFNSLFFFPLPSPPQAMVVAGRAYYDSLAKIGDISAESPVSKELGE